MAFAQAQEQLKNALNEVFNMDIRIDKGDGGEYQECVLYVNIAEIRAVTKDGGQLSYYIKGIVSAYLQGDCGFNLGMLIDRATLFNNINGLYFAQEEQLQGVHITLAFEFYSKIKELDMEAIADNTIKDMDNNITGEY